MHFRNLAVAEQRNSRVQVLSTRTGKSKACLDRTVAPGLGGPTSICLSAEGHHFLVADCSVVHYFNLRGEQEYVWPSDVVEPRSVGSGCSSKGSEFQKIMGMSADCFDNLVIADTCAKRGPIVGIYSQDTGQSVRQCKLKSSENFREPSYVACNKRIGLTYVSDSITGRVYGFDKQGKHIFTFGTNGAQKGNGGLVCPLGLSIAPDDNVYVADKGSNSVTVYPMLGGEEPVYQALTPEEGLRDPVAVSVGPRGQIAVAEETFDFGSDFFSVKLYNLAKGDSLKRVKAVS